MVKLKNLLTTEIESRVGPRSGRRWAEIIKIGRNFKNLTLTYSMLVVFNQGGFFVDF